MSVFLQVPRAERTAENELAFAFFDAFPVTEGHTLVVTKRVVTDWFSASAEERSAVMALVEVVKAQLDLTIPPPDGYNVGFNAGEAAGQTVPHLHVHVIPRRRGDMDDPRGGVRHVIPSRGNYKDTTKRLSTGGENDPYSRLIRPLFLQAKDIAIASAFVQDSGLDRIQHLVDGALERGCHIRLLTGDYLEITQVAALERLLDWMSAGPRDDEEAHVSQSFGRIEARVVETNALAGRTRSFHPKSWRFEGDGLNALFVGSSNLSRAALDTGIEWNVRVDRDHDRATYEASVQAFEHLWRTAHLLDADWIAAYERRARARASRPVPGDIEFEPLEKAPEPHDVQREALENLARARNEGRQRALAVLATGLGKTWLACFDAHAFSAELGRPARVLFLAHRREILRQAARTFRTLEHARGSTRTVTWFVGDEGRLDGDLVFASVQKLARPAHLRSLARDAFDYVVVDEVHHATAASYRAILDYLEPLFVLGLTATPDRADEADVMGLFDDNVALRAGIDRGIQVERLVPFDYFGIKDDTDYRPTAIPWRNRRFDPTALAAALETERRMEQLWDAWQKHPGSRTLVFCASVHHANYSREWLRGRGVAVDAIHSGADANDRDHALEKLARGENQAICSVDVLNEGIDVPSVDRVVMLRPTESPVVFMQQLGRGLRRSDEPPKERLTIIDFVGNHRVFLERLRQLVSLGGGTRSADVERVLGEEGPVELPTGCRIDIELEATDLLAKLVPRGGSEVARMYRELRDSRGERPRAGELYRLGYNPDVLKDSGHASWLHFVQSEGDLETDAQAVFPTLETFLAELQKTSMTKCFKMVTLQALLEARSFAEGLDIESLAARSHRILHRDPALWADVAERERGELGSDKSRRQWVAYWKKNPLKHWCEKDKRSPRAWFRTTDGRFEPNFEFPSSDAATDLVRELVDYRLSKYRRSRDQRTGTKEAPRAFDAKITWNKRDPIIKLPNRKKRPDVPEGDTDVRLESGEVWTFGFRKQFCNTAWRPGTSSNGLPDLLRGWYGPNVGHPGTDFRVRFSPSPDGWWIERLGDVIAFPARGWIRAYPDLRAAAGAALEGHESIEAEEVALPTRESGDDVFAVRAAGHSMDGGRDPIRDGDWLVLRFCRGQALPAVENRIALVEHHDPAIGSRFQLKRIRRGEAGWRLVSDNPAAESYDATAETVPIAKLVTHIPPEQLAPAPGSSLEDEHLAEAFGLDEMPRSGRFAGHLFVFVDRPGVVTAPDRIRIDFATRPGETAFVLARADDGDPWRYCGVARRTDTEDEWEVPALDFVTFRALCKSRRASRTLPAAAEARAEALVADLLRRFPAGAPFAARGRACRLVGPADRGGLRIEGEDAKARTVSTTDLGWALIARDHAEREGLTLDEALVNRLRYLEGTPKASTRFIDTGWALTILDATR